jgi:hypothetical protein
LSPRGQTSNERLQAMVADDTDIYLGCEAGTVLCGSFFIESVAEAYSLPLPGAPAIMALVLQPPRPDRASVLVAAGMPSTVAVVTTRTNNVLASWHGAQDNARIDLTS